MSYVPPDWAALYRQKAKGFADRYLSLAQIDEEYQRMQRAAFDNLRDRLQDRAYAHANIDRVRNAWESAGKPKSGPLWDEYRRVDRDYNLDGEIKDLHSQLHPDLIPEEDYRQASRSTRPDPRALSGDDYFDNHYRDIPVDSRRPLPDELTPEMARSHPDIAERLRLQKQADTYFQRAEDSPDLDNVDIARANEVPRRIDDMDLLKYDPDKPGAPPKWNYEKLAEGATNEQLSTYQEMARDDQKFHLERAELADRHAEEWDTLGRAFDDKYNNPESLEKFQKLAERGPDLPRYQDVVEFDDNGKKRIERFDVPQKSPQEARQAIEDAKNAPVLDSEGRPLLDSAGRPWRHEDYYGYKDEVYRDYLSGGGRDYAAEGGHLLRTEKVEPAWWEEREFKVDSLWRDDEEFHLPRKGVEWHDVVTKNLAEDALADRIDPYDQRDFFRDQAEKARATAAEHREAAREAGEQADSFYGRKGVDPPDTADITQSFEEPRNPLTAIPPGHELYDLFDDEPGGFGSRTPLEPPSGGPPPLPDLEDFDRDLAKLRDQISRIETIDTSFGDKPGGIGSRTPSELPPPGPPGGDPPTVPPDGILTRGGLPSDQPDSGLPSSPPASDLPSGQLDSDLPPNSLQHNPAGNLESGFHESSIEESAHNPVESRVPPTYSSQSELHQEQFDYHTKQAQEGAENYKYHTDRTAYYEQQARDRPEYADTYRPLIDEQKTRASQAQLQEREHSSHAQHHQDSLQELQEHGPSVPGDQKEYFSQEQADFYSRQAQEQREAANSYLEQEASLRSQAELASNPSDVENYDPGLAENYRIGADVKKWNADQNLASAKASELQAQRHENDLQQYRQDRVQYHSQRASEHNGRADEYARQAGEYDRQADYHTRLASQSDPSEAALHQTRAENYRTWAARNRDLEGHARELADDHSRLAQRYQDKLPPTDGGGPLSSANSLENAPPDTVTPAGGQSVGSADSLVGGPPDPVSSGGGQSVQPPVSPEGNVNGPVPPGGPPGGPPVSAEGNGNGLIPPGGPSETVPPGGSPVSAESNVNGPVPPGGPPETVPPAGPPVSSAGLPEGNMHGPGPPGVSPETLPTGVGQPVPSEAHVGQTVSSLGSPEAELPGPLSPNHPMVVERCVGSLCRTMSSGFMTSGQNIGG
ncbi:hypothetical protein [Mycobacterium sp.]|uniref:hypothetical protein n=1 Tax=Mycobacterium sp. TaxID=1785 RepID=UPI003BADBC58